MASLLCLPLVVQRKIFEKLDFQTRFGVELHWFQKRLDVKIHEPLGPNWKIQSGSKLENPKPSTLKFLFLKTSVQTYHGEFGVRISDRPSMQRLLTDFEPVFQPGRRFYINPRTGLTWEILAVLFLITLTMKTFGKMLWRELMETDSIFTTNFWDFQKFPNFGIKFPISRFYIFTMS